MAKVDAFAAGVTARHAKAFACARGCSTCCHQHLSVLPVEFARLEDAVRALDAGSRAAIRARLEAGQDDPRCPLLDDDGACRVYAARPIICRTHGLPIQLGDPPTRDVCPLNFTSSPALEDLPPGEVLDVDRLNATLVLIDRLKGAPKDAPGTRPPINDLGRVDLFQGLAWVLG